ncbi:MAG: polysaccharide biosynthesis protein [Clostridia bacterium]
MKKIFITGASGSMGSQVLAKVTELDVKILLLMQKSKKNMKLAKKLDKQYPFRIEVKFGDIVNYEDCVYCIENSDIIVHCAALIPPKADYNPELAYKVNFNGTKNLTDALNASKNKDTKYYIVIGTVAIYGNRDYKHAWGRVGDPLLPSAYDYYAMSKLRAERYVLDNPAPHFTVLRQTGILHDNLLKNNFEDGLIFHNPYNTPIEWVTAYDSGVCIKNLCEKIINDTLPSSFWNNIYNIGGGESCRVTCYETYDAGFAIMHAHAKQVFMPQWCATRNFHCMWFYDSDKLEEYLHFRTQSFTDYWKHMNKINFIIKLGVLLSKYFIKTYIVGKVLRSRNAPAHWRKTGQYNRIDAAFGSVDKYDNMPTDWKDFPLLCEGETPNGKIDYKNLKDITKVCENNLLLSHGYDESKSDDSLDIKDMQSAASFRGGKCLSTSMKTGDLWTPLKWSCHSGHEFMASPFTILKAGHWCPDCCQPAPWNYDELAKHIPFFAQVWYDTHEKNENKIYK